MSEIPEPDEDFDRWLRKAMECETPLERYTKQHCKIAGLTYTIGGTLGLIGLILAEILN